MQADTDSTEAHSRVLFLRNLEVVSLLVCSDVQSTDDDLLAIHLGDHVLIYLELLFLCRVGVAAQIQELAAEQADTCLLYTSCDSKALRYRKSQTCHLCQIRSLSTQKITHLRITFFE